MSCLMFKIIFVFFTASQELFLNDAYEFFCPTQALWSLRAKSMCMTQRNYSCLFDVNVDVYRDKCIRPRILGPGYQYVFQPNPNRESCSLSRYQPFIFKTTGYSKCVFLKSLCNSEGQTTYSNGTTRSNRICTCNSKSGFHFVSKLHHECHCNPASEDCTCVIVFNSKNKTSWRDLNCSDKMQKPRKQLEEKTLHVSKVLHMYQFDRYKYNIARLPTNEYRFKAGVLVLLLVLSYPLVVLGIYILNITRRWIKLQSKPNVPDSLKVVARTDTSITISWLFVKKNKLATHFTISYRKKNELWEFLETDPLIGNFKFTIQSLQPDTVYEIKLNSRNRNGQSKWTTILDQRTQQSVISHPSKLQDEIFTAKTTQETMVLQIQEDINNVRIEQKEVIQKNTQVTGDVSKLKEEMNKIKIERQMLFPKYQGELHTVKTKQQEWIPKNIQVQIKKEIDKWKQDDIKYVPTNASKYVISRLKDENCVTVVGSPGVGKTAVTRHVALQIEGMGYTVIPITVPTDIRNFYQPGRQTVFVIDDMCGNFTANKQMIDNWKQLLGVVDNILLDHCKIIVSCRSQVYKDNKFSALAQFRSCECNLISNDLLLSKDERIQIAKAHLGKNGNDIPEAMLLQYDCFPLLCFLYSRQENMDIKKFFTNPFVVYEKEMNNLWNEGDVGQCKICGLALCVIYNNKLYEKYLTNMEPGVRDVIDDVCEACGINRGPSGIKIKEELDTLEGTFLKKESNVYITIHDKLFDFLVHFYGTKMLDCIIKHAMVGIITERIHWNKLCEKDDTDANEFITIISDDNLTLYLNRLILDWSHGKLIDMFRNNYNMENKQFRDLLLPQLLHRDKPEQSQLSRITEMDEDGIVIGSLEACCFEGYDNLLPWFVDQGVDINRCSTLTPLAFACFDSNIEVINTLLNLGADINIQGIYGLTPLHISCDSEADPAVLDLLLKYKPCINKQRFDGATPLLVALHQNNREAVKVLLSHSADCNIGLYDSQAIEDGLRHFDNATIGKVGILLDWFENRCQSSVVDYINQAPNTLINTIGGVTPLHLMCFSNDIDMIKLLLERHPVINVRKEDGSTPLFVACLFGFIDIATIFLKHGADRNICRNDGTSPLEMAKHKNHTEVISLLENPT